MVSKNALNNNEAKKDLDKIKEVEKNIDREKLIYETDECKYSFKKFQTIKTFGRDIYEGKITIKEADEYQADLTEILNFGKNTKPRSQEKNKKKKLFLKTYIIFLRVEKKTLDAFESKILLTKSKGAGILNPDHSKLKVLKT